MALNIAGYWHGTPYNDAAENGISIERPPTIGAIHATAVVVHFLTKQENGEMHNLFMDAIDTQSKQLVGTVLRGINVGNAQLLRARIDKPPNEPGTNFPMHANDTINCWVEEVPGIGKVTSDVIKGFNTRYGGVGGRNYGHASFYVIFMVGPGTDPLPTPEPPPTGNEYNRGYADGYAAAKAKALQLIQTI